MVKYIFVTGGVLSSVGKGIVTSSIGKMLQVRGFDVTVIKVDPYVNVDAGTMNPYIHGEVFVTEDGGETDLDLGGYERFLNVNLPKENNVTTGQIYQTVIDKERRGDFLGRCVQIIPHVTNEIKRRTRMVAEQSKAEVVLTELGGTVGDIEGLPFLEAIRQMRLEEGFDRKVGTDQDGSFHRPRGSRIFSPLGGDRLYQFGKDSFLLRRMAASGYSHNNSQQESRNSSDG